VGTESKFKSLAATLVDIVENSTRETDIRIKRLKEEQARLQLQIEEIERTGGTAGFKSNASLSRPPMLVEQKCFL